MKIKEIAIKEKRGSDSKPTWYRRNTAVSSSRHLYEAYLKTDVVMNDVDKTI